MATTEQEKQRAERLLAQGVPANVVAQTIKKSRTEAVQSKPTSFWGNVKDFGIGALKSVGETAVSLAEIGDEVSEALLAPGDYVAAYAVSKQKNVPFNEALSKIQAPTKVAKQEMEQSIAKGYEATKADNSVQEAGKITGEVAQWLLPQSKITSAAKGLPLLGRVGVEAVGGATTGYLLGGEDRETDALYGGLGGAGGELLAPAVGAVASKLPKIKSLRNVFGKKATAELVEDTAKLGTKEAGDIAPVVEDIAKTADDVPAITAEQIAEQSDEGVLSKYFSDEGEILTRGEKISAIELDSKIGNKILSASKNADLHPDNITAIDSAVDSAFEQINKYKDKLKEAGKNIGDIKDSLLKKRIAGGIDNIIKVEDDLYAMLQKKGATKVGDKWQLSKASPIEQKDLVVLDELLGGLSDVSTKKRLQDVVNLMEKIDNSGIQFGTESKVSATLDRILKQARNGLKEVRDSNLTTKEVAEFKKFSEMTEFLDNFKDKESAVRLLLKRANSQFKGDVKKASMEIFKEVGGNRVDRIGEVLSAVLEGGASKSDKSLLKQMMGSETDIVLGALNPVGIATKAAGAVTRKVFAKDRLTELAKYINIDAGGGAITKEALADALGTDIVAEMSKAGIAQGGTIKETFKNIARNFKVKNPGFVDPKAIAQDLGIMKKKGSVVDFLKKHLDAEAVVDPRVDSVLGQNILFNTDNAAIQSSIRETDKEIFLNIIGTKKIGDLTTTAVGTGKGKRLVDGLKEYADETGKKLIVPDATNHAVPFWEKIKYLQKDNSVKIDFDGEMYSPPNTFSYSPRSSKAATTLADEAKKFKSADEFVSSKNISFHGTNADFDKFDLGFVKDDNLGKGFYFVDSEDIAKNYAKKRTAERGGAEKVIEAFVDTRKPFDPSKVTREEARKFINVEYPSMSKADVEEILDDSLDAVKDYSLVFPSNFAKDKSFQEFFRKNNYDALLIPGNDKITGKKGVAIVVTDPKTIKTKEQLKKIWREANK